MHYFAFSPVRICSDWCSSPFISGPSGGGSGGKPPKPSLAVLSSGWAPNGGLGMMVPPGQVRATLNRSLRATGLHGKQRANFSCWCFLSLSFSSRAVFSLSLKLGNLTPPCLSILLSTTFISHLNSNATLQQPPLDFQMLLGCADCCVCSLWSILRKFARA